MQKVMYMVCPVLKFPISHFVYFKERASNYGDAKSRCI